jgi:hypothetical protein
VSGEDGAKHMWKFVGSSFGDSFILDGIDIFKKQWMNTGKEIRVKDPHYNQLFEFTVWKVKTGEKEVTFAAGEFSNGVFGIYKKRNFFRLFK